MKSFLPAFLLFLSVSLLTVDNLVTGQTVKKNYVPETPKLSSDLMTPEVLWSFGRIGSVQVSPDGNKILYDITYFNISENKSYRYFLFSSVFRGLKNAS